MRIFLTILLIFSPCFAFAEPGDAFSMSSALKRNDIVAFNQSLLWDDVPLVFGNDEDFWFDFDSGTSTLDIRDSLGGNLLFKFEDDGTEGTFTSTGSLDIGVDVTNNGTVNIFGDNASSGAFLKFWNAEDENTTTLRYLLEAKDSLLGLSTEDTVNIFTFSEAGAFVALSNITGAQFDSGNGLTEIFDMDQDIASTDAVVFLTVDTGQGTNELYDMDQNVLTTSDVTFDDLALTGDLLVDGLNIGITADTDLITLGANTFTVNGVFAASRVIGTTAADFYLRATSDTDDQEIMRIRANSEMTVFASLTNAGALSLNNILALNHASGQVNVGYSFGVAGISEFSDDVTFDEGHLISTQTTAPTISIGPGISDGVGDSVAIAAGSTDTKGKIELTSGDGTMASGIMCTITYDTAYTTAPIVVITRVGGPSSASLNLDAGIGNNSSDNTKFTITSIDTPAISTDYEFFYYVIE